MFSHFIDIALPPPASETLLEKGKRNPEQFFIVQPSLGVVTDHNSVGAFLLFDETPYAFQIAKADVLDTYNLAVVRDVVRVGSRYFVAADTGGLWILEGKDPANLGNILDPDPEESNPIGITMPMGDPVSGLAVDPHGRILVAGGGINTFGFLKIFDPLALDEEALAADPSNQELLSAAFRGTTIVSDKFGGPGTQLPAGRPQTVAVVSNDQTDRWIAGNQPPDEVMVTPKDLGKYTLTVSGTERPNTQVRFTNESSEET